MSKSIGIDLGTTNSAAAIKTIHTRVLKSSEGEFITPSCVTVIGKKLLLRKPNIVVGRHALEWMKQDPENAIVAIKRLMGRSHGDKEVLEMIQGRKYRYRIERHSKGTANSVAVIMGGKEYTPAEISAEILKKIRSDAEKALNGEVEYAVITVPAYFNDKQKHATRTAAALAGLKVQRLLPEPTAAAISFGVDTIKGDDATTVLVFDFGGGTFDLSVLTISGGQFIEQGKGGDMWLGGEDIDRMIIHHVLMETAKEYDIQDIYSLIEDQETKIKHRFLAELKEKVEKAKIRLSSEDEAYIEILGGLKDPDGDSIDVDVELTREQFAGIIAPVVDSTVRLTRKILENIHLTPDLIDNVLLVGGSSLIPSVIEAIKQEFGDEKVRTHERPMLAVAEGAAILSHRLSDAYECPSCGGTVSRDDKNCKGCGFDLEKYTIEAGVFDIVHSAAHDYYIYLEHNKGHLLVEKNTPLPFEITERFKLVHPDQRLVHMRFFNMVNEQEESIGDLWLGIDDEDERTINKDMQNRDEENPLHVEITLKIDENNLIEISAAMEECPSIRLSKTLSRGSADERLFMELERVISDANQKNYCMFSIVDLIHRCLSIIKDINGIIDPETGHVNDSLYERVVKKIEKTERLASEDRHGKSMIYYCNNLIQDFGFAIPPEKRKRIKKLVKELEDMEERGTYEENIEAIERLESCLDDLGFAGDLLQIRKAGEYCLDTDPVKATKFFGAIDAIMEAVAAGDKDKVVALLREIMPDAMNTIKGLENATGLIHKDIAR